MGSSSTHYQTEYGKPRDVDIMRSYVECVPCFLRQLLVMIQRFIHDEPVQEFLMRSILRELSCIDFTLPPPHIGQTMNRLIREKIGLIDPYSQIKQNSNQKVLAMYTCLKQMIMNSSDPFDTSFRFAIAGNSLDCGVLDQIDLSTIHDAINQALMSPFQWEKDNILDSIEHAKTILYLTDNAGEIVFDKLLIEMLPKEKVVVAVRGYPVLNDATRYDAEAIGLTSLVHVIDNGSDAPGTILSDCSREFLEWFDKTDIIIAKGQGNYETLSEVEKNIIFALKVKCPVIARDIGCEVGDMIAFMNQPKPVSYDSK